MSGSEGRQPSTRHSVVVGVMRLARGRSDGVRQFGATRDAFLTSLAPLVAFPLVGGLLMLLAGDGVNGLSDLLATICALLGPPVLSFEVARLWGKEAAWLRFATAFNWCQWVIPVIGSLLLLLLGFLVGLGLPHQFARAGVVAGIIGYGFWLHWFVTRHALGLSGARAAMLVVAVNLGTVVLVLGPRLLALALEGSGLADR
jgi:hypothetical protein